MDWRLFFNLDLFLRIKTFSGGFATTSFPWRLTVAPAMRASSIDSSQADGTNRKEVSSGRRPSGQFCGRAKLQPLLSASDVLGSDIPSPRFPWCGYGHRVSWRFCPASLCRREEIRSPTSRAAACVGPAFPDLLGLTGCIPWNATGKTPFDLVRSGGRSFSFFRHPPHAFRPVFHLGVSFRILCCLLGRGSLFLCGSICFLFRVMIFCVPGSLARVHAYPLALALHFI